jgi:hypothetical protein
MSTSKEKIEDLRLCDLDLLGTKALNLLRKKFEDFMDHCSKGDNIVVKWVKYAKESSVVSDSIKVTN